MAQCEIHWRRQIFFWIGTFAIFMGFVWLFQPILLPFVLGFAVAYLLNPIVNALGRAGFNRMVSTIMILSGFFITLSLVLLIFAPILYREISELVEKMPEYIENLKVLLLPHIEGMIATVASEETPDLSMVSEHIASAMNAGKVVVKGLAAGGNAITSFITVLVVMPFVAFFLMVEWPKLLQWVQDLLPREHEQTILGLLAQMDKKIAGFVRGQITIAVFLAVIYAAALSILGLQYGFLIGIFAGLLNIIPLIGSTLGLLVGLVVAWMQAGDIVFTGMIIGVFVIGQIVEGNILTPKFLGENVGLHPLWIFFALMAGGALFGVTGMLISVPVAAVIGVLVGFAIEQYKQSSLYRGASPKEVEPKKPRSKKSAAKKATTSKKNKTSKAKA